MTTVPLARVDLNQSSVSRYIQLATLFRQRITSGQWRSGAQIPTVADLAEEYGVARATIRQALNELVREGLIERFRARGTFVRARARDQLWCQVGTEWSGLLRAIDGASIEVLADSAAVTLPELRYAIGTPAAAYRQLKRCHWRAGQPFLLADLYISEDLRGRISDEDLRLKTALRLIDDIPGLIPASARQTLTIAAADVESAQALQIPINAPVAVVHRRVVDSEGQLILAADGIYRGDVLRLDIELR